MLKSENSYVDENNFIEVNNEMKELTVTITLNEYRTLIQCEERNLIYIQKLKDESNELRKQNEEYIKLILEKHPEIKDKFNDISDLLRSEQKWIN